MRARLVFLSAFAACLAAGPAATPSSAQAAPSPQALDARFSVEGSLYVAELTAYGEAEAAALNEAIRLAVGVVMDALGKDALYRELFFKAPPLGMSWRKLSSEKGLSRWSVRIRLSVDDESLRILQDGAYYSSVVAILAEAEKRLAEAEARSLEGRDAEAAARLGAAMGLYWIARDEAEAGLRLLAPIGDVAIFSEAGRRKAPELRDVLSAIRQSAVAGYARIEEAERSLSVDRELESVLTAIAALESDALEAEAWAEAAGAKAASVEGMPRSELEAFVADISLRRKTLGDARASLDRLEPLVPKDRQLARARIGVLRSRIDRAERYLGEIGAAAGRELRTSAVVRARRAQALRWTFFHEPSGAMALRLYTPFGLDPYAADPTWLDTGRVEFSLRSEGAFGGSRGFWIASALEKDDAIVTGLSGGNGALKNTGYSQSLDLGFYGEVLAAAGLRWDWLRRLDGDNVEKRLALRASIGGMSSDNSYAAWLLCASWEFPYVLGRFEAVNYFNVGLDGFLRLGRVAQLEAGASYRPRETPGGYDASLRYRLGAGFRLPKPFLWGLEFAGHAADELGGPAALESSYLRFYLEYSL